MPRPKGAKNKSRMTPEIISIDQDDMSVQTIDNEIAKYEYAIQELKKKKIETERQSFVENYNEVVDMILESGIKQRFMKTEIKEALEKASKKMEEAAAKRGRPSKKKKKAKVEEIKEEKIDEESKEDETDSESIENEGNKENITQEEVSVDDSDNTEDDGITNDILADVLGDEI